MSIAPLSLTSAPIQLYFDDQLLGTATGCFREIDNRWLLVTAWHNLSGRHRWTMKALRKDGGIPNKIVFHGYRLRKTENGQVQVLNGFASWTQPLIDDNGVPLWKVHPDITLGCDVAIMECVIQQQLENIDVGFISPLNNDSLDMALDAGSNLFILGFPFGIEPYPIWKRATVASQPALMNKKPIPFLSVDTATKQGLSGSPVFSYETSSYRTKNGDSIVGVGPFHKFVGLYTGRRPSVQGDDAQVGIVWPTELIEQIISFGVPDLPGHELDPIEFPSYKYLSPQPSQFSDSNGNEA